MNGSSRTLWIMGLVAVVSLGAGLGLSQLITSPADAAAQAAPPDAGPITVPVERRTLANDVVLRGDAIYENPVSVVLETGDIGGPAIVTGQVPVVGATIDAGQVILEVAGRPVILLTGELPVYRTLRPGVSGPDVLQLKAALAVLGINPGDQASPAYDSATSAAVEALYARVGYPAPSGGEDAQGAVTAATEQVRSAQDQVAAAQRALAAARAGTPQSQRVQAQADVNTAQATLNAARTACTDPTAPECDQIAIVAAEGDLAAKIALREEINAPGDTADAQSALSAAQRGLADAQSAVSKARTGVLTPLPASELVYLAAAPRRVDSVEVSRGSLAGSSGVMSVSGATLQIAGAVPDADAELIAEGSAVTIELPGGDEVAGTVQSVGAAVEGEQPAEGRTRVVVVPGELTDAQRAELQGANVRMTIPVSSTQGDVLAVPTAALTAGPGGEARVEVLGDDGESTLVTVETGLAADGFVEVTATDGTLEEGDRVVVGVTSAQDPADDPTDEATSDEGAG